MEKFKNTMMRIWNSCKRICSIMVSKTITETDKISTVIIAITIGISSIMMFIILVAGLILSATGITFFNKIKEYTIKEEIPLQEGEVTA